MEKRERKEEGERVPDRRARAGENSCVSSVGTKEESSCAERTCRFRVSAFPCNLVAYDLWNCECSHRGVIVQKSTGFIVQISSRLRMQKCYISGLLFELCLRGWNARLLRVNLQKICVVDLYRVSILFLAFRNLYLRDIVTRPCDDWNISRLIYAIRYSKNGKVRADVEKSYESVSTIVEHCLWPRGCEI